MALQQLVARGSDEAYIGITNKESIEYISHRLVDNGSNSYHNVERRADMVNFKGFIFDSNLELQELWNKIDNITLIIGGCTILKFEKPILQIITNTEKIDNQWLFLMDFKPFFPDIPIVALAYHEIKINISLNNRTGLNHIECITKYTFLDTNPRREIATRENKIPIQQIQGNMIEFVGSQDIFIDIKFSHICKGYFICGDINNIEIVTLKYNDHERYNYNKLMLRMVAKKINDKVLYIPYNHLNDWKDRTINSYIDGLNHSRFDRIEMNVKFSTPQTKIGLYGLNINNLICRQGMAGVQMIGNGHNYICLINYWGQNVVPTLQSLERWSPATKPIPTGKSFCPIAYTEIVQGSEYCECNQCHNCFYASELRTMFTTMANKCPLCRKDWSNWTIYKNN